MKRFYSALALCVSLLLLIGFVIFPAAEAKEDPIRVLLDLPAPPPPNPLVVPSRSMRDEDFFNKLKVPPDDAPIEDLLEYWRRQSERHQPLRYLPTPSDAVVNRIFEQIKEDPSRLPGFLNILPKGKNPITEYAHQLVENEGPLPRELKASVKKWLTYNSPFYSTDLVRLAERVRDADEYLTNQEELLALAAVDYDRAKPIVDRLYGNNSQPVSRVLAMWARYRNALATNSTGDIETYRNELKAIVEDKKAGSGMRDLALDALSSEKEWKERDDWYVGLLGDETLAELRVNGSTYTGLTTPILYSPPDKYRPRMMELLRSDSVTVRSAAIRNLLPNFGAASADPELLRALTPWLEDPKWAKDIDRTRSQYIRALSMHVVPESVPGLVKMLSEMKSLSRRPLAPVSNTAANKVAANVPIPSFESGEDPYLLGALIAAVGKQKDARAIPGLRRHLAESPSYPGYAIVEAILLCGGFSIDEQMAALEATVTGERMMMDAEESAAAASANAAVQVANAISNAANYAVAPRPETPITQAEIVGTLGSLLQRNVGVTDELAEAVVERIGAIEGKDPRRAAAWRKVVIGWEHPAIDLLTLRDLRRGIASSDQLVVLITRRAAFRQKYSSEIAAARAAARTSAGIASCLFEDRNDYDQLIETGDADARIALYACARLIRGELPVAKVAKDLDTKNEPLKLAAARYLESEDSPAARRAVLDAYPNEIKVLGARSAFYVNVPRVPITSNRDIYELNRSLYQLFASVNATTTRPNLWVAANIDGQLAKTETELVEEVKKDKDLAAVYSFESNYIRVYKDRAVLSWDEDESRYRERPLTKSEFESFTRYLSENRAEDLPPFIDCSEYCPASELLMVGRNGGRRVYFAGNKYAGTRFRFAEGLTQMFDEMKRPPAKLKYNLSREIPGLELVLATDDFDASTVWKGAGDDLRVVGSVAAVREQVDKDLQGLEDAEDPLNYEESSKLRDKIEEMAEKRRFEGYGWYKTANGELAGGSVQPPGVSYLPERDSHPVEPDADRWKTRTAAVEVRSDDNGIYKIVGSRFTRIREGNYSMPVVSPNGRWVLALKTIEEYETAIVRIDLATNREYTVKYESTHGEPYPIAVLPGTNRVLVVERWQPENEDEDDVRPDPPREAMLTIDLTTGAVQRANADLGPLSQQTFRPLQPTAKPGEVWAAVPDREKHETLVGTYNLRTYQFKQRLRVPKIMFNSMKMWVDEPAGKLYFTYRGHVLSLPMKTDKLEPPAPQTR